MATNPISPWLERLKRRFSQRRTLLNSEGQQALPGGDGRTLLCVVGRDLCLYALINASKIPANQRTAFVTMAVRRAAPFPDPEFGVAWLGDLACVWYWSRSRIMEMLGNEPAGRISFVPESLLVGAQVNENSAELLALAHGVEGRAWKDGRLAASRWWPAVPNAKEWAGFARGAGLSLGTEAVPTPVAAPLLELPWSTQRAALSGPSLAELESQLPRLLFGIAVIAALTFAFELGAIGRSGFNVWQARSEAESLDQPLKKILAAREAVDQNSAAIAQLLALRPPRFQLELLAEVAQLMQGRQWQMRQWEQTASGQVEVTLSIANPNLEQLVTSWEASPMFEGVSTELSGRPNEVKVKARLAARTPGSP